MAKKPGRTNAQLAAWRELLELCEDDCEVFQTSKHMREAVIEVERELTRLHRIEALCISLAIEFRGELMELVPEVYT